MLNHRDTWSLTVDEPVAANYYPVTAVASVKGVASSAELFVVTDRSSQGATSLSPGELEFMVHRRCAVQRLRIYFMVMMTMSNMVRRMRTGIRRR